MNRRLEGWRLALAILLPAAIIAAAIWIALSALNGDDGSSVETAADTDPVAEDPTPLPTSLPETQLISEPTVVPTPTPLALPDPPATATPAPTATALPTATAVPASSGGGSGGSGGGSGGSGGGSGGGAGPTATPTTDPTLVTVTCTADGGAFPTTAEVGENLPEFRASVSPPEAAATMQYLWNLGNNSVVGAPNTGTQSYGEKGSYTVTLTATNSATGKIDTVTCGTITVGASTASGPVTLTCQVRPLATSLKWADAGPDDIMVVSTTWKPADTELRVTYEYGVNDPLIIEPRLTSPHSFTRNFSNISDTVKIFWRNEATGDAGRAECRAFPEPTGYNVASTS